MRAVTRAADRQESRAKPPDFRAPNTAAPPSAPSGLQPGRSRGTACPRVAPYPIPPPLTLPRNRRGRRGGGVGTAGRRCPLWAPAPSPCSCALGVPGRPSHRVRQSSWPAGGCSLQLAPTEELLSTRHRHALTGRSAEAPNAGALLFLGPMLRCPNPRGRGGPGAGVPLAAIRGLRGRESESRRRSQPARWSRAPRSAC
jgi:hypothetical protein